MLAAAAGHADIELDGYPTLFRDLFLTFRSRGVSREEAQDLAQETILRTLVHLRRHGKAADDLGPLVRTIGRNLFIERVRRAKPEVVELSDTIVDDAPEPHELIVEAEQREQIQEALRSLTPRHRHVVQLWMQGLTPGQIARELGIKRNAADAILHRARRRLATVLENNRGAFSVIGLLGARLRVGFRRAVDSVVAFDPAGSLSHAATGLAAVGIAAAITVGAAGASTSSVTTHVRPVVNNIATGTAQTHVDGAKGRSRAAVPGATVGGVLEPSRVGAVKEVENPATGQKSKAGFEAWYQPDGHDGPIGRTVANSFGSVCGAGPAVCANGGR